MGRPSETFGPARSETTLPGRFLDFFVSAVRSVPISILISFVVVALCGAVFAMLILSPDVQNLVSQLAGELSVGATELFNHITTFDFYGLWNTFTGFCRSVFEEILSLFVSAKKEEDVEPVCDVIYNDPRFVDTTSHEV